MVDRKALFTFMLGGVISGVAACTRLNARDIALPHISGPFDPTAVSAKQMAIADISLLFLVFGLIIIVLAVAKYLFTKE